MLEQEERARLYEAACRLIVEGRYLVYNTVEYAAGQNRAGLQFSW